MTQTERHTPKEPTPPPVPGLVLSPQTGLPLKYTDVVRDDPASPSPHTPPIAVYLAEDVRDRMRPADRWQQIVTQTMIAAGIYVPAHADDPLRAVNDLIVWASLTGATQLPVVTDVPVEEPPAPRSPVRGGSAAGDHDEPRDRDFRPGPSKGR